jgi:hypothetical protein
MTRFSKGANGKYVIHGTTYEILNGTRAQVWHGTAYKTSGGLTKSHLIQNKSGRIVSKSKHNSAKHDNRLVKSGYGTKKGKFGFVKLHGKSSKRSKSSKSSKSKRGGSHTNLPLNPAEYHGNGVGTSGPGVQFVAGNAS